MTHLAILCVRNEAAFLLEWLAQLAGGVNSAELIAPADDTFERVSEEYFAIAQTGTCTEKQRAFFFEEGKKMIDRGAEAVILAGTDLCLAFDGEDPGYPVLDSALIHVDAIFVAANAE